MTLEEKELEEESVVESGTSQRIGDYDVVSNENEENVNNVEGDTKVISSDKSNSDVEGSTEISSGDPSEDEKSEEKVLAPPKLASWWTQTSALIWKNLIAKYRTKFTTIFEVLSPGMLLLFLVLGYNLSEIQKREARTYANWTVDIPGPYIDILNNVVLPGPVRTNRHRALMEDSLFSFADEFPIFPHTGSRMIQDEKLFDGETDDNPWTQLIEKVNKNKHTFFGHSRILQENSNTTEADLEKEDFEQENGQTSLGDIDRVRYELYRILRSPIPVPTLPLFIQFSQALTSQLDPNQLDEVYLRTDYVRRWGNLLTLGTIHITPQNNPIVDEFLTYIQTSYDMTVLKNETSSAGVLLEFDNELKIRLHDDHDTALDYILNNLEERTWALIDFDKTGLIPLSEDLIEMDDFKYKIRMNYTTLPNTNRIVNWSLIGLGQRYQRYYTSGYLTLQRAVNEFATSRIVEKNPSGNCDDILDASGEGPWSLPFPTASYNQNPFFTAVGNLLGLTITMAFSFQVSRLVKSIVEEKESRMKETLAMLGVRPMAHWLSWILTAIISFGCSSFLVTYILTSSLMKFSDPLYLAAFIGFFAGSIIGFSFFIASLFSRAKLASIVGPIALFVTLLPRFIFFDTNRYEAVGGKMLASLLPCSAFAFGSDILADYEYAEIGLNSSNASEGGYSFNTCLSMMFFDTFFYIALAWYFEEVIPRQYGVNRKFYFCLTPSYLADSFTQLFPCFFREKKAKSESINSSQEDEEIQNPNVEKAEDSLIPQVFIQHLVKDYNTKGQKPAVNDLNLTMYESQITCLLGHNGAGKTTTISVLTGLYKPTSGDCVIYGKRVTSNLGAARRSMGICPQHNILFHNLTVSEHLAFFERIKGLKPNKKTIKERAEEVGLGEFLYTQSHALSGGNKRKLHVAIAFCGDPEFLLLDEPTSGMDPYSRRSTWELLRRKRAGRVTLLTTHFMDEAELLADRIAVLKEGSLQCCGSNIFLKNKFGLGYNITIVTEINRNSDDPSPQIKNENLDTDSSSNQVTIENEKIDKISNFLQKIVPGTLLIRKSGRELVYRFPQGGEESFPTLFDELETSRKELGIGSYGATNTTLEEVFLQLAENESTTDDLLTEKPNQEVKKGDNPEELDSTLTSSEPKCVVENEISESLVSANKDQSETFEYSSGRSQLGLLLTKRFMVQKRDRKGTFFTIVLPAILSGLVLLILMVDLKLAGPGIDLSVDLYKQSSSGADSNAIVLAGGGLGAQGLLTANSTSEEIAVKMIEDDVSNLNKIYSNVYPHARFSHIKDARSSQQMSDHMLKVYREPGRIAYFGSLVFKDSIKFTINVNWDSLERDLEKVLQSSYVQNYPEVNLTEFLGSGETELSINITTPELEDFLNDLNITENATISVNATRNFLGTLNETIFPNSTSNIFTDIIDGINNSTLIEGNDSLLPVQTNISISELINILNENTNGTSTQIDGRLYISRGEVYFNPATSSLRVSSLKFETNNANISLGENITIPLDVLLTTLSDSDVFNFQINNDVSVMHNSSSAHAVAAFNQAHHEYQFMKCSNTQKRLISVNHPLPLTSQQSIEIRTILSIFASLFLLIPYCYIPAAFCVFLVKERVTKSKHLQLVSGVNMTSYWVSSYLWDMFLYGILTTLIMCIFLMYGTESAQVFVGDFETFFCTAALTFGYGLSGLPFAYLFSRFFNNHSMAQISIMALFFVTGFVAVNAYYIMDNLENTKHIAKGMRPLFWLWPPYNVGDGLINLSRNYFDREVLKQIKSPFQWVICGRSLALLYGLSVPYFLLLLILEYSSDGGSGGVLGRTFRWIRDCIYRFHLRLQGVKSMGNGKLFIHSGRSHDVEDENIFHSNEDSDVADERNYVIKEQTELRSSASVLITNLWKIYPRGNFLLSFLRTVFCKALCCCCRIKKTETSDADLQKLPKMAVQGLTTAVMSGETFGLLGVNGAGKTTTLGVLTGDIRPTGGQAYVSSHDVTGSEAQGVSMARQNTGFCPQVDPLIELMTGRETLRMFGRLRGIPKQSIDDKVTSLLELLTLTPHADKVSVSYSGGNKRKLSLGIALIGNPAVMLIDEASSGMDPLARRKMWDLIAEAAKKRSVILTTHSMEEAEALCTRVAIMVGGKIRCLGSVQHLKNKFLGGYSVELHCKYHSSNAQIDSVKDQILNEFTGSVLAEQHGRFLKFDLPSLANKDGTSNLGSVFRLLQSMKTAENSIVDDYSVSQCSLEQVFISLVQEETEENKHTFISH